MVPLDIDELRDSVVLGRFNAVSSLAMGEAAGGPEGLNAREGHRGVNETTGSNTDQVAK